MTIFQALLPFVVFLAACTPPWVGTGPPDRSAGGRPPLRTARVTRGDVTGLLIHSGDLRSKPGVTISPRISGRLERLFVEPGSPVREGDAVAELDRATLEVQVVQGQAALASAEARLAALQAGGDPDTRAEAEARLRAARARLASLDDTPRADSIPQLTQNLREARRRLAELDNNNDGAVARAEARLAAARGRLDQLLTGAQGDPANDSDPTNGTLAPTVSATPGGIDRRAVDGVRAEIRRAEEDLARSRRPVTGEEVAGARQEVALAEEALMLARSPVGPNDLEEARANVEAAELRLRRAGAPSSDVAIKAAESAVDYAWAALELARLQLREATLTTPISGVVAETMVTQGSSIGAGTPVVRIQPPDYELILTVEERQIGQLQIGQGVNVVVDAYPNESFSGTVRSLAPTVDLRTRTVAAKVDVLDPQLKLKAGLFAQTAIAGQRRQNALLVPREAIVAGVDPSVMQVVDGRVRRQTILTGVSDGRIVEVVQGLAEGAEVVLSPAGLVDGDPVGER
jgi:HlyD family secretion protein